MMGQELFEKVYAESHLSATRKHVAMYRQMGFSLIPLHFQTKKPVVDWTPYQTTPPTETEIQNWFFADTTSADKDKKGPLLYNLAVVLGPVSGNLFGIDIDGFSAQARYSKGLADLGYCNNNLRTTLLHTFMTRSGSHKGYHALFRVSDELLQEDDFYRNLLLGKASQPLWQGQGEHKEIKFLGRGSLAVLPPSIHPSGKCQFYVWNNKPPQLISTAKELAELFSIFSEGDSERAWNKRKCEWARKVDREQRNNSPDTIPLTSFADSFLGAAAGRGLRPRISDEDKQFLLKMLMKNNRYRKGNRHRITMGVAGFLRWRAYTMDAALKFIDFVCDFFHDEETDSRRRDVIDTYSKPIEEIAWRSWLDGID
jgi:hypothetical protein